jgi:hypothetical protein
MTEIRGSVPSTSSSGGNQQRVPESTQIGLAALQQKALKQQEQLEQTSLGFRFPLQMSPLFTRAELSRKKMKPRRDYLFLFLELWFYWFGFSGWSCYFPVLSPSLAFGS